MTKTIRNNAGKFAAAYQAQFKEAATKAAGDDGRLTQSEAKSIPSYSPFRESVDAFFDATQQSSVSTNRLVDIAGRRAEKHAGAAIGRDGEIKSSALPGDLAQIYLRLAKTVPAQSGHKSETSLQNTAEEFLEKRIATSRGWSDLEIFDVHDATSEWYFGHTFRLTDDATGRTDDDLIKYDFAIAAKEGGEDIDVELGIGMDRRTGEILEVYIGREGAASADQF